MVTYGIKLETISVTSPDAIAWLKNADTHFNRDDLLPLGNTLQHGKDLPLKSEFLRQH